MNQMVMHDLHSDCERACAGLPDLEAFRKLDGTSIFITGGTGFVGSWLCHFLHYVKTLHRLDFKVYVQGRDQQRYEDRVTILSGLDTSFVRCDIRDLAELPREVNYVIHLAGSPDSRLHLSHPMETMADIAEGTRAVLLAANRASNLRMIVHISSGSVYGTQPDGLIAVEENQAQSRVPLDSLKSAYIEAKRYAEVLCTAARSELRLPIVTLRPFTFIGPFQPLEAPWAINNFINDGLRGRAIRILGDGKSIRGFLYGADAAAWIVHLMLQGRSGQVYNIGSPHGASLLDIAEKVASNFEPRPEIVLNAAMIPNTRQNRYLPDVGKLSSDHQLLISTGLDLAIKRTIQWYSANEGY